MKILKNVAFYTMLIFSLCTFMTSCKDNEEPKETEETPTPPPAVITSQFTANLNGSAWSANSININTQAFYFVGAGNTLDNYTFSVLLSKGDVPCTKTLTSSNVYLTLYINGTQYYAQSGELTITEHDRTKGLMRGTFNAYYPTPNITVTNGTFIFKTDPY